MICSSGTAARHFSPITNRTRSWENRVSAIPNGIPHINARRLALTNVSCSSGSRSLIAQIAGYRVPLTRSSTREVNAVMFEASATAPTPARPRRTLVAITAALTNTTLEAVATKIGPENDAYTRSAPRSYRHRTANGQVTSATVAPAHAPATNPSASAQ